MVIGECGIGPHQSVVMYVHAPCWVHLNRMVALPALRIWRREAAIAWQLRCYRDDGCHDHRRGTMKVKELMTSKVTTCNATDDLAAAAMMMWREDCGVVPVLGGDHGVLGVI